MSRKPVFVSALVGALLVPAALGIAEERTVHQGPWPIYDWTNHQPTEGELRTLHERDVSRAQAREVDQLYDQLMSTSDQNLARRPAAP
jgi:hypothetical protein